MVPIAYNLEGLLQQELSNLYGISKSYTKEDEGEFLGTWKELQLFWSLTGANSDRYKFDLKNKEGDVISTKVLDEQIFGEALYGMEGNPQEHRKLQNERVYILAGRENNALITILPLKELFPEI